MGELITTYYFNKYCSMGELTADYSFHKILQYVDLIPIVN